MDSETSILDRIERAQNQPMTATVIRDDPMIVVVDNEQSGNAHTIVPTALHCSCPDHTYRSTVCKHIAFLALGNDEQGQSEGLSAPSRAEQDEESVSETARDRARSAITDHMKDIQSREVELRAELRELNERRRSLEVLRGEMPMRDYGFDASGVNTDDEEDDIEDELVGFEDLFEDPNEDDSGHGTTYEMRGDVTVVGDEEMDDSFTQMVASLTQRQ